MKTYPAKFVPLRGGDLEALITIVRNCAPIWLDLHMFESIAEVLDEIHADRLFTMDICIRSDVRKLPECDATPWLDLLERSPKTLKHLKVGGRLLGAECEVDDSYLDISNNLESLTCLHCKHTAPTDVETLGNLYPLLARNNRKSLENVDAMPFEDHISMFLTDCGKFPRLTGLSTPMRTDELGTFEIDLWKMRQFSALETLELHSIRDGQVVDSIPILTGAIEARWFPKLKLLDMSACPLDRHDEEGESFIRDLQGACQSNGTEVWLYDQGLDDDLRL